MLQNSSLSVKVRIKNVECKLKVHTDLSLYYYYLGGMKVMSGKRDPCRSPMQWDDSNNSGFTSGENTWLPVNPSYLKGLTVQDEMKNESSPLNVYKKLVSIRRAHEELILWGSCEFIVKNDLLLVKRQLAQTALLIILNFSKIQISLNLEDLEEGLKTQEFLYHHPNNGSTEEHSVIQAKGFSIILCNSI